MVWKIVLLFKTSRESSILSELIIQDINGPLRLKSIKFSADRSLNPISYEDLFPIPEGGNSEIRTIMLNNNIGSEERIHLNSVIIELFNHADIELIVNHDFTGAEILGLDLAFAS